MCECGCGEFRPDKAVRIGDKVLAIEIYPGCRDCDTGIMVSLHIFTTEEAARWDLKPIEEFKPDQFGSEQMDFPIIGKEDLVHAAEAMDEADGDPFEDQGYANLIDWLSDNGLDLLQRGLRLRLAEVATNEVKG
jgi:hypothetical protein